MLKIWRSPYSRFGVHREHPDEFQDETILAEQNYTEKELAEIAGSGFNGIWVHALLHHIVQSSVFPELGGNCRLHQDALHALCRRAAKYGIRVFLYMQPPRALPVSNREFWSRHGDVGGQEATVTGDDESRFTVRSLCTSHPVVQEYIRGAFAELTRLLPELGGYLIISASEYPAHCYSNRNCRPGEIRPRQQILDHVAVDCPRCGRREPEDVVVELLQLIRDGVRSVSETMELIFWNWSWTMYLDSPCESIISRLPRDILLLADFERGGYRQKDGAYIDEYSLGYSGPSEQYLAVAEAAARRGIAVIPKFQLGTTHELATVRSLPIYPSLFRKADFVRKNRLRGFLGCWNFGNLPSDSIAAFHYFLNLEDDLTEEEALTRFAAAHYPGGSPGRIVQAWRKFAEAMEFYPFIVPFLYNSPVNLVLGLIPHPGPLDGRIVGRSWLPDDRGDSYIESETSEFPLDDIIRRFQEISRIWNQGLELLSSELNRESREFGNAAICGAVWESTENMYRIYRLKKTWKQDSLQEYRRLVQRELDIAVKVLPFVSADPEQGWHIEGNLFGFNREMILRKIESMKREL